MRDTVAMILGGGRGTRLLPLTEQRAKPAVPVGGKYRLVDVPISNCINSGVRRIYVLTQYRSASLHRHIAQTYSFDSFSGGFVEILAAEQRLEGESWFEGSADAVRKNLQELDNYPDSDVLVMNGDILFRHDLARFVQLHREREADITVLASPCSREEAVEYGLVKMDARARVVAFIEKPQAERLDDLLSPPEVVRAFSADPARRAFMASIGMYVFRQAALRDLLRDEALDDFGHHVLPRALETGMAVCAAPHDAYWRDLGTIPSFFQANLDLADVNPSFSFYDR
ncbi:MAG: sugar phosphate nucleotidyltransferase, partial [Candidatus Sumerlaeota bacterium]|nr:sugar phosphate nucleotidyltransferase [Candidatus Sumerlaeota bacterium]